MATTAPHLSRVSISEINDELVARFEVHDPIPVKGVYLVGLVAASADHSSQRRLEVEFLNGEAIAFYTFNHDLTAQENHALSGVEHEGTAITAHFPLSSVRGLGSGRIITAFSHVDGEALQTDVPVTTSH